MSKVFDTFTTVEFFTCFMHGTHVLFQAASMTEGFLTGIALEAFLFVMNSFHMELNIRLRGKCFVADPALNILLDSMISFKMMHQVSFVSEVFDTFTTVEFFASIMYGPYVLFQMASLTEGFLTGIALVVSLFVMNSFHMELCIRL